MKENLDDKIETYNMKMNDATESIHDLMSVSQELLTVTRSGKSFKSVGLGEQSLEEMNTLSTLSTSMKESFDTKLALCNQKVSYVKEGMDSINESITDVNKITEELVTVTSSGNGDRSITYGEESLEELRKFSSCTTKMEKTIDGKIG